MIKQAYFRGLMKVAADELQQQLQQQRLRWKQQRQKDSVLAGPGRDTIPAQELKNHSFYKGTPTVELHKHHQADYRPTDYRNNQAFASALKFIPNWRDPIAFRLHKYYEDIGRQNRDFYLKQGFRPPKDHKYKTPFPFPNHPKKKQMMLQNQYQVNNNRGQQYKGHA